MSVLPFQVLVIIDVKPKDLGLPTEAYISVEEIHDVSESTVFLSIDFSNFILRLVTIRRRVSWM